MKIGVAFLFACVLLSASPRHASAGVEPSPFQPEINKLHSIELHTAAIGNRLAKLNDGAVLPAGVENYLEAMALQMDSLSVRLADALAPLPAPTPGQQAYEGQNEVIYALEAIRAESDGANQFTDSIAARLGVDPSPFKIGSLQLIEQIDFHVIPVLPPSLTLP